MTPYQAIKGGYSIRIHKAPFTSTTFSWRGGIFMENDAIGSYIRKDMTGKMFNAHIKNMMQKNFNIDYVNNKAVEL